MSKRYLVTGGAGFIGSHLCDALADRGDEVIAVDNLVSGSVGNLAGLGEKGRFIQADVRSLSLESFGRLDAIIHLAALISGFDSLSDPQAYVDANIGGTAHMIASAAAAGVPRIVFASSSTIYGANARPEIDESVPPAPLSVYAMTKLAGEQLLRIYGELHGFTHCSLRLFNVYGPRQTPDHPYANVACKFSHAAAQGSSVKLFGDGEQTRDFVYVGDVVKCLLAVLEGSAEPIYNVGTGQEHRINDLLSTLSRLGEDPLTLEREPEWPNDIRRISADVGRFRGEFGFSPEVGLDEGLDRTVRHFRQEMRLVGCA